MWRWRWLRRWSSPEWYLSRVRVHFVCVYLAPALFHSSLFCFVLSSSYVIQYNRVLMRTTCAAQVSVWCIYSRDLPSFSRLVSIWMRKKRQIMVLFRVCLCWLNLLMKLKYMFCGCCRCWSAQGDAAYSFIYFSPRNRIRLFPNHMQIWNSIGKPNWLHSLPY